MDNETLSYREETIQTLNDLFDAATAARGQVLDQRKVRMVASYINNLTQGIEVKDIMITGCDNMLAAYMNEYGEQLYETLLEEVEAEVAFEDAEVVVNGDDDTPSTNRWDNEGGRVDSSHEEEE